MKNIGKNSIKFKLFFGFLFCSFFLNAQDAPPSDGVYRLKNVATGKYLTDAGSGTAVTMSDSGDATNTHFKFVLSGSFYNIDSEVNGILRSPGSGGPGGAYVVVGTSTTSPSSSSDKIWKIQHNQTNDTYRFQSGSSSRYMYHDANGTVTHIVVSDTDDRSNWELIPDEVSQVPIAPDEDTGSYTTCNAEGENATRTCCDLPNPVNDGTIDDRSCYANYKESSVNGKTWGVYNITHESNNQDAPNTLQPRIERSLSRSSKTGVGSYARFTGTVRILETGKTDSSGSDGTYIAQAKGKHTGGGGSSDPAICLYLAKPVYGTGVDSDKQVSFDIYAERILYRGGSGSGREVVFLKNVEKNVETSFELEIGFRQDPNNASAKIHYCDAVIGGTEFNFNIPEPDRGTESGIRYGAYRVKGGRAQVRWANTTYQKEEIDEVVDPDPIVGEFRLRNVATGEYLTDAGVSASPVTMSASGDGQNKYWTLVESGAYYNIDSEVNGVLRAPGSGGPGGPYVIVSTGTVSPSASTDKTWTIHHNEADNTYRFESRTAGRFLYHEANGDVTHTSALDTDDRSNWEVVLDVIGVSNNNLRLPSVKIYPNPAKSRFTLVIQNLNTITVKIYNVLGGVVYEKSTNKSELVIDHNLSSGIYLVQIVTSDQKVYLENLIIK